jgi:hypothetical protein
MVFDLYTSGKEMIVEYGGDKLFFSTNIIPEVVHMFEKGKNFIHLP